MLSISEYAIGVIFIDFPLVSIAMIMVENIASVITKCSFSIQKQNYLNLLQ